MLNAVVGFAGPAGHDRRARARASASRWRTRRASSPAGPSSPRARAAGRRRDRPRRLRALRRLPGAARRHAGRGRADRPHRERRAVPGPHPRPSSRDVTVADALAHPTWDMGAEDHDRLVDAHEQGPRGDRGPRAVRRRLRPDRGRRPPAVGRPRDGRVHRRGDDRPAVDARHAPARSASPSARPDRLARGLRRRSTGRRSGRSTFEPPDLEAFPCLAPRLRGRPGRRRRPGRPERRQRGGGRGLPRGADPVAGRSPTWSTRCSTARAPGTSDDVADVLEADRVARDARAASIADRAARSAAAREGPARRSQRADDRPARRRRFIAAARRWPASSLLGRRAPVDAPTRSAIIVGIVLMIMLHEAGHFIAAKRAGMKVTEFFVGFGPRAVVVPPGRDRVRRQGDPGRRLRPHHRDEQPRGGRSRGRAAHLPPGAVPATACRGARGRHGELHPRRSSSSSSSSSGQGESHGPSDHAASVVAGQSRRRAPGCEPGDRIVAIDGAADRGLGRRRRRCVARPGGRADLGHGRARRRSCSRSRSRATPRSRTRRRRASSACSPDTRVRDASADPRRGPRVGPVVMWATVHAAPARALASCSRRRASSEYGENFTERAGGGVARRPRSGRARSSASSTSAATSSTATSGRCSCLLGGDQPRRSRSST